MKKKTYKPNLFLKRELFFENCTVGSLMVDKDDVGDCNQEPNPKIQFICHTLEPRRRNLSNGERKVVGKTCVPAGIYPIEFSYDDHLKYKCPRLKMTPGFLNVRICFVSKSGSKPKQSLGNILLGYVQEDPNRELDVGMFDGKLYNPAMAFKTLKDYFEKLRANREDMVLEITDGNLPPKILPAIVEEEQNEDWEDEDFMLATL